MPPPLERKRISRACDPCRLHKQKCDGQTPTCRACKVAGRTCTTELSRKKRGLRGGYLRRIEALLGWVLAEDGEKSLRRGAGYLQENPDEEQRLAGGWKESRVGRLFVEDEGGETLDTVTGENAANGNNEATGNLSNLPDVTDGESITLDVTGHFRSGDGTGIVRFRSPAQQNHLSAIIPSSPPLSGWQERVQIFLLKYHCWLPILDKSDLFRIGYAFANGILPTEDGEKELFHAVMALTLEEHTAKRKFFQMAVQKAPWDYKSRPQIQIQLNLLLILYQWGMGDWTSCMGILKFAINDARALGIDRHNKSRQRLLWLGCCLLDTLLAFRLNRTPMIKKAEIEHSLPIDIDGAEEWEPWHLQPTPDGGSGLDSPPAHILSTFQESMLVICWLNDILTLPPSPDLFRSFDEWSAHLPRHCQVPNTLPPSPSPSSPSTHPLPPPPLVLPHTLLLHLTFTACQIARVRRAYPPTPNLNPSFSILQPPSPFPTTTMTTTSSSSYPPLPSSPTTTSYPPPTFLSPNPDPLSRIIHLLRLFALSTSPTPSLTQTQTPTPIALIEPFFHVLATSNSWLANQKRFLPPEVRELLGRVEGEWPEGMGGLEWRDGGVGGE